jgi:HAD superfamily hydrolase (TIGR01509 family)
MIAGVIRALIFDFDGLILETEGPIYHSWQEVYQAYGQTLPVEEWVKIIGTWDNYFDPHTDLESRLGYKLDWKAIESQRHQRETSLVLQQPILPGVTEYLQRAHHMGLKVGVASSSKRDWVEGHLRRLGLLEGIDCLRVREDVKHTKPDPELYLSAAACLGVNPGEAIAFEDSHHGVISARRAGLYVVAVPNDLTSHMPFAEADLRLDSLASLPLEKLIAYFENSKGIEGSKNLQTSGD